MARHLRFRHRPRAAACPPRPAATPWVGTHREGGAPPWRPTMPHRNLAGYLAWPHRARHAGLAILAALGSALVLLLAALPASALDVSGTPSPVTGNATWFTGLGSPYGGCGLPQADLDSQNFLALNVQNSPGG